MTLLLVTKTKKLYRGAQDIHDTGVMKQATKQFSVDECKDEIKSEWFRRTAKFFPETSITK